MANYNKHLNGLRQAHRYRQRRVNAGAGVRAEIDNQDLLNFCSNDYLGLSTHPQLIEALTVAAKRYGVGAGASHLVSGHHRVHHQLEERLAAFVGRQRALLFSTGYMANLAVVSAFAGRKQQVIQDKLNHASLIDAAALSGASLKRYAHGDAEAANLRLKQADAPALLASDAVFSMDGDLAPVVALADYCQQANVLFMLDDAHGFGVLGKRGAGVVEVFDLDSAQLPLYMATLGKAMGVAGAFVAGDDELIDYLLQRSRPYIYTTAMPIPVAAAALAALDVIESEPERRGHLHGLIAEFRTHAVFQQWRLLESTTAIQPLVVGDDALALELSEALMSRGYWVSAIRPPTVPERTARLRVTLSAAHSKADVLALCDHLKELEIHYAHRC